MVSQKNMNKFLYLGICMDIGKARKTQWEQAFKKKKLFYTLKNVVSVQIAYFWD